MNTFNYSNSILPYIPFFYVIWSDDLLSASEIEVVKIAIDEDGSLSKTDRKQLYNWLDKNDPPKNKEIKNWQKLISNSKAKLIESETYPLESFSQKVYQIYSYDFEDLITDVKYTSASSFDVEGCTVLDHDKLSEVEEM